MRWVSFSFFNVILLLQLQARAQCDGCKLKIEEEPDLCYVNSDFDGYCAAFNDGVPSFALVSGKKSRTIPLEVLPKPELNYFLKLTRSRDLKLSAMDLLFIQEALKVWELEGRKIGYQLTSSGLGIKIIRQGPGSYPQPGEKIKVHYAGYLEDGSKFDSSFDRNEPLTFVLGMGKVIKGWDEGIALLNKGAKAYLKVPPELGYGTRGAGRAIPPNATLIFEVELLMDH